MTGDSKQAQRDHVELFEAFEKADEKRLIELTAAHSRHTCDRLISGLSVPAAVHPIRKLEE